MLRFTLLLLLSTIATSSALQTSLCCCGCTTDHCPKVGSSCRPPQEKCTSPTDLKCSDLQQIWEDTHGKEKVSWSTDQSPDDVAAKASPLNEFPVPLDDQRLISIEKGERGTSQFKATFVPQGATVALDPSLAMLFEDGATGTFLKTLDNGTVETASELPTQTVQVIREIVVSPEPMNDDTPTFEKLEAMIDDLQQMLKKVKQNILDQAANRTTEKPAESEDMSDPISEEMERKVVEDVIERMRGSFMRAARGSKTMNEIDSSVSASVVDVQTPLRYRLPGIRYRRESSDVVDEKKKVDETSNCNDPKLKELIMNNIGKTAQLSKRAIQKAAEVEYGGTFDVICSPCEFSFVISSQKYCDGTKDQAQQGSNHVVHQKTGSCRTLKPLKHRNVYLIDSVNTA